MTRYAAGAVTAAVLLALPATAGTFELTLLSQGFSWAILALSVWLLLRVSNLPSFGHAAFFGVGAYVAGLAVVRWEVDNVFVAMALAIAIACAVALPIAVVAARLQGISFLLITLAFAEMLHALAGRWSVLGGSDGLVGVIRPGAGPLPIDLSQPTDFYLFSLGVLVACSLGMRTLVRSCFGGALKGIRESENRMAALGYNATGYRVAAFLISAGIAAVAGVLNAYLNRFVDPGDVSALVSARALLIVVIGGASILGPPLGAVGLTEMEDFLSSHTDRWLGVLGALYVLVALLALERGHLRALGAHVRTRLALRTARRPAIKERS